MIPRGLLPGQPIDFHQLQVGDIIDTYSPDREHQSRFHKRLGQTVTVAPGQTRHGSCDLETDYDMICKNLGLWIQLRHRPTT